jgi:hypothetical protein
MTGTDEMATGRLSDEVLETAGGCDQVPTILNASYCLTCWHEEEVQKQEGGACRPFDTPGTAASPWPFEGAEINAKVASTSACDLVRSEGALLNQPDQGVSDEELEAAADSDKLGLNTLGLTLMAPPPCC